MTGPADPSDLPKPERNADGLRPLEPGAERTDEFDVTGPLLTGVGGTIGVGTHQRRIIQVPAQGG
jgi:hypothetical protein